MDQIQVAARFSNIPSSNVAKFNAVREAYDDSNAVLAHVAELVGARAGLQLAVFRSYFQGKWDPSRSEEGNKEVRTWQ